MSSPVWHVPGHRWMHGNAWLILRPVTLTLLLRIRETLAKGQTLQNHCLEGWMRRVNILEIHLRLRNMCHKLFSLCNWMLSMSPILLLSKAPTLLLDNMFVLVAEQQLPCFVTDAKKHKHKLSPKDCFQCVLLGTASGVRIHNKYPFPYTQILSLYICALSPFIYSIYIFCFSFHYDLPG